MGAQLVQRQPEILCNPLPPRPKVLLFLNKGV